MTTRPPGLWSRVRTGLQVFATLFAPERFAERIMQADYERELARNAGLASGRPEQLQDYRDRLRQGTIQRARLLRGALLKSLALLASAAAVGTVAGWAMSRWCAAALREAGPWTSVASVCVFVWATLGRMGWKGQTFKGDTIMERADDAIFRSLYWLGTFLGVLAVWASIASPTSTLQPERITAGVTPSGSLMWLRGTDWTRVASVVKDFTLAGAAGFTAYAAIRGINEWRRQIAGTSRFQAGERVINALFAVRDAVKVARQPMVYPEESAGRQRRPDERPHESSLLDEEYAYRGRLEPVLAAREELDRAGRGARVHWGQEAEAALEPVVRECNSLFAACYVYFPAARQSSPGTPLPPESLRFAYERLYQHGEDDRHARALNEAVESAAVFFRARMVGQGGAPRRAR